MKNIHIGIFVMSTSLCAQVAAADELTLRGSFASGFANDYIYALEDPTSDTIDTDYGRGALGSVNYKFDQIYGNVGLDLGLQLGVLSGSDDTGGELNSECDGGIETFLGLIADCQDRADTENTTAFAEASALATYTVGSGNTELLAGLSYLQVRNDVDAEYLFPGGFENFVDRDTEFSGFGLKLGARHTIPLQNGMNFNLEGFVAQYRGDRTLQIDDEETFDGGPNDFETVTIEDTTDVTTFELTPSLSMPATWAGKNATMEFGVSYKLFSGVVDTRNVVSHGGTNANGGPAIDAFSEGTENDDISATSIFAGLTIPLN